MIYKDIYNQITSTRAFGVSQHTLADGQTVGISSGINMLIKAEPNAEQEIAEALERFFACDFGDMYGFGEQEPDTWHDRQAYGEYEIDSLDEPIYIHYEPNGMAYDIVIYLIFER